MSSKKQRTSSASGVDDKKRKRMISNRESARRSRIRKQQQVEGLISQVAQLNKENKILEERVTGATYMYVSITNENNILRAQLAELADRLRSLNTVLHNAQEVSGLVLDIQEIPETLMEPWILPCPVSTSMFQC